jgi:hypothetical protein
MSSIARLSAFPHVVREIMQQFKGESVHLIGLTGTNSRRTSPLRHDRLTPSSFSKQAAQRASDECPSTFANGSPEQQVNAPFAIGRSFSTQPRA